MTKTDTTKSKTPKLTHIQKLLGTDTLADKMFNAEMHFCVKEKEEKFMLFHNHVIHTFDDHRTTPPLLQDFDDIGLFVPAAREVAEKFCHIPTAEDHGDFYTINAYSNRPMLIPTKERFRAWLKKLKEHPEQCTKEDEALEAAIDLIMRRSLPDRDESFALTCKNFEAFHHFGYRLPQGCHEEALTIYEGYLVSWLGPIWFEEEASLTASLEATTLNASTLTVKQLNPS